MADTLDPISSASTSHGNSLLWYLSVILMVVSVLTQIGRFCLRKIQWSDEDYKRDYFSELEFEELINFDEIRRQRRRQ